VAAVGKGVSTVREGDVVSAEMHVACGKCLQCRTGQVHICQHVRILGVDADGAFAGYTLIPETNIWKLPAHCRHHGDRYRLWRYWSVLDRCGQGLRSRAHLRD
jgi:threonine 3-dehydrogenase